VNYTVLLGAFVFESWALYKARTEMKRQMNANDWGGYREAFRKTSDTTTLTALTEDTIALLGIVIALVGLFLEQQTGNPFFDRVSALLIGIMLMGFASRLRGRTSASCSGRASRRTREDELRAIVADHSGVVDVLRLPHRLLPGPARSSSPATSPSNPTWMPRLSTPGSPTSRTRSAR